VDVNPQLTYQLTNNEVQYALAIGTVAVLVLLLLRKRPAPAAIGLFLGGALIALACTPLLEVGVSIVDRSVSAGSTRDINADFWRTLIVGGGAAAVGITCIARAWRDSPER
jgi:hypothetical protein